MYYGVLSGCSVRSVTYNLIIFRYIDIFTKALYVALSNKHIPIGMIVIVVEPPHTQRSLPPHVEPRGDGQYGFEEA